MFCTSEALETSARTKLASPPVGLDAIDRSDSHIGIEVYDRDFGLLGGEKRCSCLANARTCTRDHSYFIDQRVFPLFRIVVKTATLKR